jgi:hypothetical protein
MPRIEPIAIAPTEASPRDRRLQPPCGWWESSLDLMRGLEVIEHEWPADSECEELMAVVSFG